MVSRCDRWTMLTLLSSQMIPVHSMQRCRVCVFRAISFVVWQVKCAVRSVGDSRVEMEHRLPARAQDDTLDGALLARKLHMLFDLTGRQSKYAFTFSPLFMMQCRQHFEAVPVWQICGYSRWIIMPTADAMCVKWCSSADCYCCRHDWVTSLALSLRTIT